MSRFGCEKKSCAHYVVFESDKCSSWKFTHIFVIKPSRRDELQIIIELLKLPEPETSKNRNSIAQSSTDENSSLMRIFKRRCSFFSVSLEIKKKILDNFFLLQLPRTNRNLFFVVVCLLVEIKNIWRSFFLSLRPLLAFGFVFFCLWIYRSLWCVFGVHVYYEKTPFWEGWILHLTFCLQINGNSSFLRLSRKLCNLKLA